MNVFTVGVGADEDFTALKVSGKPPRRFMGCARVNVRAFWKALHHVVKLDTAVLVVQELRTQELIERCFRLTANAADELLSIPDRLAELGNVAHDTFHVAARLRAFFVIHEVDDCDLSAPPSCISRRTVLIFANSARLCPDWQTGLSPCSPAQPVG